MVVSQFLLSGLELADGFLTCGRVEPLACCAWELGGIDGVKHLSAVSWGYAHRCVYGGCGSSAHKQRYPQPFALHQGGKFLHLMERGGDESAQTYHVGFEVSGMGENGLCRDHHAEIVNLETVAAEYYCHYVFADVVNITFDGSEHHAWSVRLGGIA